MNAAAALIVAVAGWIVLDAAIVFLLLRRSAPSADAAWFDHDRFVNTALVDRVKGYARPLTIAHPCSYGGDTLEYPVAPGWDEDAILGLLAEIEAL